MEETWILNHLPLVRHIVHKVARHARGTMEFEDLVSAGTLGLVKAARSFDPSRETEFKTYAYIRIRGAVIDELRGRTFVPSAVHHEIKRIEEMYRIMAAENGQPPGDEQLARACNLPVAKMYAVLEEARRQQFLSIHGLSRDEPAMPSLVPPSPEPSPDEQAQKKETLEALTVAIMDLPQRDRHVIVLYYDRDLTMKEIAEVLGVTESRVSQVHAAAVFKLAMALERAR
jgi:RNA polymerase sigma factor for flagellar operon FliA